MSLQQSKYAAIDIGSNAVRLLICDVFDRADREQPHIKKTSLIRVPIRLGQDVFVKGKIGKRNLDRLTEAMQAYSLLMRTHGVTAYRAYATSAMREAGNGSAVTEHIHDHTGIKIEIIDGKHEAAIIAMTNLNALVRSKQNFLYVDVGGGSTEFTLFKNGENVSSKSFKLGTVRLLNGVVDESLWDQAQTWIEDQTKDLDKVAVIGSGGNINTIFKRSGKRDGKPLSYFYLLSYYEMLQGYSYEERILELQLNPDRADVIIPACRIYLRAMKWAGADDLFVPKIGLSDGIIKSIYNDRNLSR